MIDENPVLQLRRHFPRPENAAVESLRDTPTGFVVDCMEGRGALPHDIKPLLSASAPIVGVAVTCACGPSDNLGVLGALDIALPGDIIVAATDNYLNAAVIGDLVLEMMKNKGVVAFVTDGLVRDIDGIERVGLPTYCAGVTPNSPNRNGPASAGLPVNLGSVSIHSGDVIVGDRDGVVVVPREQLTRVTEKLVSVREAEADLLAAVEGGLVTPSFYRDLVESGRVVELAEQP